MPRPPAVRASRENAEDKGRKDRKERKERKEKKGWEGGREEGKEKKPEARLFHKYGSLRLTLPIDVSDFYSSCIARHLSPQGRFQRVRGARSLGDPGTPGRGLGTGERDDRNVDCRGS